MRLFLHQLTVQGVVSPHPRSPDACNCCVSVLSKQMRGWSTQQLSNLLVRLAHADTVAPRPPAEVAEWVAPSCSDHSQLRTMASETVVPIDWPLLPTLHREVPPELHILHSVNSGYKSQDLLQQLGREHSSLRMPGQRTAFAVIRGMRELYYTEIVYFDVVKKSQHWQMLSLSWCIWNFHTCKNNWNFVLILGILLQVVDLLERGERLPQPERCSNAVYRLMLRCWHLDPVARPTFQYLAHHFSTGRDYVDVKPYLKTRGWEVVLASHFTSQQGGGDYVDVKP